MRLEAIKTAFFLSAVAPAALNSPPYATAPLAAWSQRTSRRLSTFFQRSYWTVPVRPMTLEGTLGAGVEPVLMLPPGKPVVLLWLCQKYSARACKLSFSVAWKEV